MIKKISISLNSITSSESLMREFARVLNFPGYFGYNWDAFYDMLNSITTETSILQASRHPIESVHFIFCDFDIFELVFPPTDFAIFSRLLIDISRRVEDRSGDMKYTFEIRNTH